jgi:hypothetical protein
MARYNDQYYLRLLFENDARLRGDWSEEGHRGKPLAGIVTGTLRAIASCYEIPEPARFFDSAISTVLRIQIEARRGVERTFERYRGFLAGVSREQTMSKNLSNLLTQPSREIDQLIAVELGIAGQRLDTKDVVACGGRSPEDLHEELINWF